MAEWPFNHIIKLLLERRHNQNSQEHHLTLGNMISKQQQKLKSSIIDMNNHLNGIFSSFDSLNDIFHPGHRLIDIFPSCFSVADYTSDESKTTHCKRLDKIIIKLSSDPRTVAIISDMSIQNNVATSIAHIHSFNNLLKKTLHHAINVTSMEAELFAIRCGINQAIQIQYASHIIVIIDMIHAVEKIFDSHVHPHQQQAIAISKDLKAFFSSHEDNTIKFWDCPNDKWHLHSMVDKETKQFNLTPLHPSKESWDYSKRRECDVIIKEWHLTFKSSNLKGRNFLQLLNNNLSEIEPAYTKEDHGYNNLVFQTRYVLEPHERLPIMLRLENIA